MKNKRDLMIEKEIREKKTNVNIVKNNLIPTIAFVYICIYIYLYFGFCV